MRRVNWDALQESCNEQEFPILFTDTLLQICKKEVPLKKLSTGKPKLLNALRRKKKRLLTRLRAAELGGNQQRIAALKDKVALLYYDIKEAIVTNLENREKAAVTKIKSNPKFFYSNPRSPLFLLE